MRSSWHWFIMAPWLLAAAACHDVGDIRVASLTFEGNSAVPSADIKAVLATRAGGRLPWSPAVPFDEQEFQQDLVRIRQLYEGRGYPNARVSALDIDLNDKGDAVRLHVGIDEGVPVVVEDIRFVGFEALAGRLLDQVQGDALKAGDVRDRARIAATERRARETFLDNGFAYAVVAAREGAGAAPGSVVVTVEATPGPPTTFGDTTIVGNTNVSEDVIRRQLTFEPGDVYRQRDVVRSERRLGGLEILRFTDIDASASPGTQPVRIPVTVTVAEDPPRRLELRGGYGTEDRLRGGVEWAHLNFLGDARLLAATTKWSSIDRGARVAFTQPYFLRAGLALDASASTWWTSEQIYTSDVHGGRIGLSYRIGNRGSGPSRPPGRAPVDVFRAAYVIEDLSYSVRPEVLEDLTNVDALIALGLDPITGEGSGTRTAAVFDYERTATDNIANPRQGYGLALHYEEVRPALGGTFDYRKMMLNTRGYVPIGRAVIAARARVGTIVAESDKDLPFSERFFLGGSSSLRGWGRYQVAPLQDGITVGGRTVLDASLELRVPVRDPVGAVVFVDTGNVWSESLAADAGGLRTDAGVGLRYATPIGLIRADIGVQLNPIDGLLVNGERESRTWRIHLSIGQAF